MKQCKLLNYLYMAEVGEKKRTIGRCIVSEYPEVEKELNNYLKEGWEITPMGFGTFYLEREIKSY